MRRDCLAFLDSLEESSYNACQFFKLMTMDLKRLIAFQLFVMGAFVLFFVQKDLWHALAAFLGGGIAFLGGVFMVRKAKKTSFSAPGAVRSLFTTEAIKLLATIAVFFVAALVKVPLAPLFSTYCATLVLFWTLVAIGLTRGAIK
jgi:F0F1-type ATP synthase assembly protein I